jgi:hypothetical protein
MLTYTIVNRAGFPRIGSTGSPVAEKVEKAKIVHLAHVLHFAWLHNIAVQATTRRGKREKGEASYGRGRHSKKEPGHPG